MTTDANTLREAIKKWYASLPEITLPNIDSEDGTHMEINLGELAKFIQSAIDEARLDQMNYVDQRLIGKNTTGDRAFYDKDAVIAENKLKDHQRIISDSMKAEIKQLRSKGDAES